MGDGGDRCFFLDGTEGDRGIVEVVPHSDEVKYLGMKIDILVKVFRGSEGRTAFVKKSKRASGSAAEIGGSILVNVCNMIVSKRNRWVRSGRGHCPSNLNPQINHGPCILCVSLHILSSI